MTTATATTTTRPKALKQGQRVSEREQAPHIGTHAHAAGPVRLHASRELYLDHVEKHFAKTEALQALGFAMPEVAALPEFGSDRALIRALRCDAADPRAMQVLDGYARCAAATLDEAAALGWIVSPRAGTTIAFATSGLLAVIDGGVLRTMFFAGIESQEDRAARLGHSDADAAAERRREATWSADERHFYRVFRPAIQLIRKMPDDAVAGACSQYGALKRVLPSASALRFEAWLSYRARSAAASALVERSSA